VSTNQKELRETLLDCAAHLAGIISAYEKYVGRVDKRGSKDPFYKTRIQDYKKSLERTRLGLKK